MSIGLSFGRIGKNLNFDTQKVLDGLKIVSLCHGSGRPEPNLRRRRWHSSGDKSPASPGTEFPGVSPASSMLELKKFFSDPHGRTGECAPYMPPRAVSRTVAPNSIPLAGQRPRVRLFGLVCRVNGIRHFAPG